MKLPLAYYGDPFLRKKCAQVDAITDEIRQLVKDMEETMFAHDGVGLAACQIHRDLALFIANPYEQIGPNNWQPTQTHVFINPKIVEHSEEDEPREEGCLSIPTIYATVIRPVRIKVEFTDLEGNRQTEEFSNPIARIILHENDHINGVLFIDRVRGRERKDLERALKQIKKKFYGNS